MAYSPLIQYLIKYQEAIIQKDFLIELFMIPERVQALHKIDDHTFEVPTRGRLYKGKLFVHEGYFYAVDEFTRIDDRSSDIRNFKVLASDTGIVYDPTLSRALCKPRDAFDLVPGDIANLSGTETVDTTIGTFIANYAFLVYPFGDTIPYLNEEFDTGKLENRISRKLMTGEIDTSTQLKDRYVNALSLIGQSNEIFCPNISEKTISVPPHIHALRKKLIEENREALDAGDASVMSDIEQTLIKEFKDYLKGDPSMDFLIKKKYFNVVLKKLFLTQGMTEKFSSPGKFTFIEQPMGSGWQIENLPDIFNEVRAGSYARAIETANGGVIAKLILRVLQDTRIVMDDCGTTQGTHIHGTKDKLKDFIWNYQILPDGSQVMITDDNLESLIGHDIVVRTPGHCKAPNGYCAKCFGRLFEVIGQKAFAPVANNLAREILTSSLKQMHGKSHSVFAVTDLNKYLTPV